MSGPVEVCWFSEQTGKELYPNRELKNGFEKKVQRAVNYALEKSFRSDIPEEIDGELFKHSKLPDELADPDTLSISDVKNHGSNNHASVFSGSVLPGSLSMNDLVDGSSSANPWMTSSSDDSWMSLIPEDVVAAYIAEHPEAKQYALKARRRIASVKATAANANSAPISPAKTIAKPPYPSTAQYSTLR